MHCEVEVKGIWRKHASGSQDLLGDLAVATFTSDVMVQNVLMFLFAPKTTLGVWVADAAVGCPCIGPCLDEV